MHPFGRYGYYPRLPYGYCPPVPPYAGVVGVPGYGYSRVIYSERRYDDARPYVQGDDVEPPRAEPPPEPAPDPRFAEVNRLLGRGDRAFEDGDYDGARREYVRALVLDDGDPRVRIAYALSAFALGEYDDAAEALREGISRAPRLATSPFDLRRAYGRPEDLRTHLDALVAHARDRADDADLLLLLGFVRFFSGDTSEGLADFERYVKLRPDDAAVADFIDRLQRSAPPRRAPSRR